MQERTGFVTFGGRPVTLVGGPVEVDAKAPDFEVVDTEFAPVKFSVFAGRVCLISSVASLDTSTCDRETRKFNQEVSGLDPDMAFLTISMDLPFAQKRWLDKAGATRVQVFSDYRDASFGQAYGVLIEELRLLARAVFLVDKEGTLRYLELVREVTNEPDYDAVLGALRNLVQG